MFDFKDIGGKLLLDSVHFILSDRTKIGSWGNWGIY